MADKPAVDPFVDAFLAVLDTKIAALQQLRESYIAAASVGAIAPGLAMDGSGVPVVLPASGAGTMSAYSASSGPIELPTGVFRTKGLADAIRLYLSIAKRKQTAKEIATALQDGGLATTADSFEQTLSATLYRLKNAGELLKFKDGWDLAASYPESFRQRLAQAVEARPKSKSNRKAKTRKKAAADRTKGSIQKPAATSDRTAVVLDGLNL